VAIEQPRHWTFATPREALEHVLAQARPLALGIGEFHQIVGSAKVQSALSQFSDGMIGALAGRASDLIVETWVEDPTCGKIARRAVEDVKTAIARPAQTENELLVLLARARDRVRARPALRAGSRLCPPMRRSCRAGRVVAASRSSSLPRRPLDLRISSWRG
jgi:hypothetical protein